jgi:chemotaxis signal transduction protein
MDKTENSYLAFTSKEYDFLLPLSWVDRIAQMELEQEKTGIIDLAGSENGQEAVRRYLILLKDQGTVRGLCADALEGIYEIAAGRLMPLPVPVINDQNRYLSAAVCVMREDETTALAYVVNPEHL